MTTPAIAAPYRIDAVVTGAAQVPCPNLYILDDSHVQVWANDVLQVLDAHYRVLQEGQVSGCVIEFLYALGTNTKVTVLRFLPNSQSVDYDEGGPLPSESHETALDRLTMLVQMVQELANRALKYSIHTIVQAGITTLPSPVSNFLLGWNQAATAIENKDPTTMFPGLALLSTAIPQPVGAAGAAGSSGEVSRSDHVHAGLQNFSVAAYGATGDGVTDDTVAIQAALTAAGVALGGIVFFPNGVYLVSAQLVIPDNTVIMGETVNGVIILQAVSTTAINGVFRTDGSTSLSQTISVAAAKGARTITLTDATGYAIGDLIEIRNTEAAVQAADGSNNAFTLLTLIMDLSGNLLTLHDPLPFAVGASDTETVVKVTPKSVELHNLSFNGINNTGQAPFGNNAIVLFHTRRVALKNISIDNYQKGYGIFLWSSFDSTIDGITSQNSGDTVGLGAAIAAFDSTHCTFNNLTALWPSRDGIVFIRNSLCRYSNLTSVRASVRNVKFHGCRQVVATNIIGNNSIGGTGLAISGGTSDSVFSSITTTGNKGPNASGNQNGVWFADLTDQNNVLSNVNSWDNGDWDITVFSTDTGNVVNGARFSTASKVLNQNRAPMFDIMLDDVLSGGLTSVGMVETTSLGSAGPSHRLLRHASGTGLLGEYVFAGTNNNNALVEYAKFFGTKSNETAGAETGGILISAFTGGVNYTEMTIANGITVGSPTGGATGVGTINAQAVFDDNALLSDYVFDPQLPSPERFNLKYLDPKEYAEYWKANKHLPSMPSREEWQQERKSLGELIQRLWETVELQAIHIETIRKKVE